MIAATLTGRENIVKPKQFEIACLSQLGVNRNQDVAGGLQRDASFLTFPLYDR
jgi:hypothetical protein